MATESFFSSASLAYLASAGAGKDGKAYSIKPTDGTGDFTFSRGSNLAATRVGPTGLIEKGRENLILQSNQFDTTWIESSASVTGGQSGYDGSSDAWLLSKSAANGRVFQNIASSGVQTFSVYAKAAVNDWAFLLVNGGSNPAAWFDLSTGSLGSAVGGVISHNISDVGNGWYKISISFNETISRVRIYVGDTNGDNSGTSGSIYIQDAQLEIGLAATDYIESGATTGKAGLLEDEPRFDYSGGATCPSLLLEPSRTNLVKYSEYLEGTGWLIGANTEKVSSNNLSPSGELNAYKFKSINITGSTFVRFSAVVADNTDYTFSCYARSDNPSALTTGKLLQIQMSGGGQLVSISSTLVTSGWQRFDITATSGTSSTAYCYLGVDYDVDAEIEFWGAQLEQGSYPTSYIPNHSGGTITRGEDSCSVTGISSLFGQTEGTLFLELEPMTLNDNPFIALYANSSNYLEVNIGAVAGTQYEMRLSDGTNSTNPRGGTPQANTTFKLAIKVESGNQKTFVDGTEIISSSIALDYSSTPLSILAFNRSNGNNHFYGNVKQTLVFPEALSDADCIAITTL